MRRDNISDRETELLKRIETERTIFRYSMLASAPAEVYDNCNKIRLYECIYEYFQYAEDIDREYINACLRCESVIESIYDVYTKYEHLRCGTWTEIEELLSALVEYQKVFAEDVLQQPEGK